MSKVGIALFLLAGCATRPPQITYVQARSVVEAPRRPAVVSIPKPLPLPGQLKPVPRRQQVNDEQESVEPWLVIDKANRRATQTPTDFGYFNSIMLYDYAQGALYQVYAAPLRITDIALQPGEQLMGAPALGDTVRWVVAPGKSMVSEAVQRHVYVKPTRPGLNTTLTITTDRRTYFLELHSFQDTAMVAVSWRYPQDEMAELQATAEKQEAVERATTAPNINIDAVDFGYEIRVEKGSPRWTPLQVFTDNRKTFIRFPPEMLTREAPVLFVLSAGSDTNLVNYRVRNEYFVVDRVIDQAELRLGTKNQEIVRIVRASAPALRAAYTPKGR